jgi:ArsR family transcriptional regulator, arsenate/arsenite/antimonite-responsive transcriptional repressor
VATALKKKSSLRSVIGKVPKVKQEWLHYIGLYPYQESSPTIIAIEYLIDDPQGFRKAVIEILQIFWEVGFKSTWNHLQPQFQRSLNEKERLFQSCSLAEFAQQALLRIQVNEKKSSIKAIRGGYELPLRDVKDCYFMPSAFNDRRYWSALKDDEKNQFYVYFPYFDPSIALDLKPSDSSTPYTEPELDASLIFKALGDSTRFAIVSLLAKEPTNSVELAKQLSVSKPTISHHVHQLREAGLIDEHYQGGSVQISLRRHTFERISEITIHQLFNSAHQADLKTTRSKEGSK